MCFLKLGKLGMGVTIGIDNSIDFPTALGHVDQLLAHNVCTCVCVYV